MSNELICPKCGGDQRVSIIKAIPKGVKLILITRCPNCGKGKRIVLDFTEKKDWIEEVANAFFTCDLCGTVNSDKIAGYKYDGGNPAAYWYYYGGSSLSERKKIEFVCKKCSQTRVKVTTGELWQDIKIYAKTGSKEPKTEIGSVVEELNCPKCGKTISKKDRICPNCGLELVCDKCNAPIVPGSKYCSKCGDRVEMFDIKPKKSQKLNICPSCNEEVKPGTVFCDRCGQEILCDKCGAQLLEGSSFCNVCGDPVTRGELDI